jgi:alpha-N-acetylglucosaminidase
MDRLLATRNDFLLGRWVADARAWGTNEKEKALYEMNAKDLITLWGDEKSPLNEYACRQWSGLLKDFYKPRWQQFFTVAGKALEQGKQIDLPVFQQEIAQWEWKWVNRRQDYPVTPMGDPISVAKQLYKKYRSQIEGLR